MNFAKSCQQLPRFIAGSGPVLATRVRLARNIKEVAFRRQLSEREQEQLIDDLCDACERLILPNELGELICFKRDDLTKNETTYLVERHLLSPNMAASHRPWAVCIDENEHFSMMLNEEDHLRLQCYQAGQNFDAALEQAILIDQAFENEVAWSFDDRYGYLTSCPSNCGTGMRASILMHLPALGVSEELPAALRGLSKLHMAARGMYGESSESEGYFVQISNQQTLGLNEEQIVDNVRNVVRHLLDYESMSLESLLNKRAHEIEDQAWRALATLCAARLIVHKEATELISKARLGISAGFLPADLQPALLRCLFLGRSGHLAQRAGHEIEREDRASLRAEFIRDELANWA